MTKPPHRLGATAAAFICAVVLAGCGQGGTSAPEPSRASATPRPYFTTGAELEAYAAQRRQALTTLAAAKPTDRAWGSMTMTRPIGPTELKLKVA